MRTTDLFKNNRAPKKLNETIEKTFGVKLNLESFTIEQLEDARNKLRTQIYTARSESSFNETIENDTLTQAQWMHDAIVAELMVRNEPIVDNTVEEAASFDEQKVKDIFRRFESNMHEIGAYGDVDYAQVMSLLRVGDIEGAVEVFSYSWGNKDGGEVRGIEDYFSDLEDELDYVVNGSGDEGYGDFNQNDVDDGKTGYSDFEPENKFYSKDATLADRKASQEKGELSMIAAFKKAGKKPAPGSQTYALMKKHGIKVDEDTPDFLDPDLRSAVLSVLQEIHAGASEGEEMIDVVADELGDYFDDVKNSTDRDLRNAYQMMRQQGAEAEDDPEMMAQIAKQAIDMLGQDDVGESAPPTAKGERMVKHIKKGYADDGKLTDKEKSIAYATAWKQHNKESIETGEDMTRLQEGEIQQASAIVTAKTMVDRVGRWIEELSGMENDTLLQLGDSIRDEMGQEQAKQFISACAPAIQQALQNLKDTRETLASGVRTLTGEEQPAEMLGGDAAEAPLGGEEEFGADVPPDEMNAEPELDAFAAAEPAVGGDEAAGRAQRESINYQNKLLKVLAG